MKLFRLKYRCNVLCLFTALFCSVFAVSQNGFAAYSGKIIDGKSGEALNAASLSINKTNIGTVTNSEGQFILKVEDVSVNLNVVISLLGYKTLVLPLSELSNLDKAIALYPLVTELSAVSISAFKDPETLVKRVFQEKHKNLQSEPVEMTAFYRETIKRRSKNVSLTEAIVYVLRPSHITTQHDDILLGKARKSTDYKRLDTLSVKLQGGPFSTIYLDIMKYPEYIFTDNTIESYNFSFDDASTLNNRSVYVVNFSPKNNGLNINYFGKLYIDVQSLALVSADYALDISNKRKTKNLLVAKKPRDVTVYPLEAQYKVDYKLAEGKWYYSYSNLRLKFKIDKKRELFNKVYTLSSEMAVTNWEVKTNITKIRNRDKLKPAVIITDAISGFSDPNFWGEYNLIEPDKTIESAINKIRKSYDKENEKR